MMPHLVTATKAVGLAYRLLSTTVLIGFLVIGTIDAVRKR